MESRSQWLLLRKKKVGGFYVLLKQQTLRPSLTLNRKKLSAEMVTIYEKTWASGSVLGYISDQQYFYLPIVTSHLDPHPR